MLPFSSFLFLFFFSFFFTDAITREILYLCSAYVPFLSRHIYFRDLQRRLTAIQKFETEKDSYPDIRY